jgi:hypothetical protein
MSIITVRPFGTEEPVEVEILDFYECGGVQLASVEAVSGKPFVGGNKWAVRTPFTIVKVSDLIIKQDEPAQPQPLNLLTMALAYADKPQWYSGEVLYIWGDPKRGGAYLKEEGGFIRLNITHYPHSCLIFGLGLEGWFVSESVNKSYQAWATRAQEALK